MIKKETILKTAITYWSVDDECFITESPMFLRTAGIGETPEESKGHFEEMLNELYMELIAGKVAGYSKVGRPSKGTVDVHGHVKSQTKTALTNLAVEFGVSLGEAIDYLLFFYDKRKGSEPEKAESVAWQYSEARYEAIEARVAKLDSLITHIAMRGPFGFAPQQPPDYEGVLVDAGQVRMNPIEKALLATAKTKEQPRYGARI